MILVGVAVKRAEDILEESLKELAALTETAGGKVAAVVTQRVDRFKPGTLIGDGKIDEVAQAVRGHKAKAVIFDDEVLPAQQRTLEARIPAKILDRTRLILDIFSQRARTKAGELQVELAQLSYMLPRLTGRWRGYSQQVGGIGTRGPGERKLEYERRHIQFRIEHLRRDIERMKRERSTQRERRSVVPVPQAALVGYTNVGKSTLLNSLTKTVAVYADDKLFATLDPTSRRVKMPEGGWAVVTDTVGFIQKLPTSLIAAFRSTLEEAIQADCLVHVIDAASPNRDNQIASVELILKELGAEAIPRVNAFNKADQLDRADLKRLEEHFPDAVFISAKENKGLKTLLTRIQDVLNERWMKREIDLAPALISREGEIHQCAQVLARTFHKGHLRLKVRITPENWDRIRSKLS